MGIPEVSNWKLNYGDFKEEFEEPYFESNRQFKIGEVLSLELHPRPKFDAVVIDSIPEGDSFRTHFKPL